MSGWVWLRPSAVAAIRSNEVTGSPWVPTGRNAGYTRPLACSQSCSGVSAADALASGGVWPLTGAESSIGAR